MSTDDEEGNAIFDAAERAFGAGEFERAGVLWESIGDPDSNFNAGNAYREAGRLEDAKRLYRKSIEGGVADAHLNLAYLLEDEGDDAAAARELEAGVAAKDPGASVETARRIVTSDPERARSLAEMFVTDPLVAESARSIVARAGGTAAGSVDS